jgi:spoIIIJ-associated protein
VSTEPTQTEQIPGAPVDEDALLDDQADAAEDFIHGLLDVLDMDGEAEADFEGDAIFVDVTGPEMALLIGRHGATLEAIQDLVRAAVQHKTSSHVRLTLDIDGYRERQRELLERRVRGIAAKVARDGQAFAMEPMSSYERKVIHDCLATFEGVRTGSEGEAADRHVVITPA